MAATVGDVMTRGVITAREGTSFKEVALLLAEHRIGALPVVGDAGTVLGVVFQRDLLVREEPPGQDDVYLLLEARGHLSTRVKAAARFAGALMTAPAVTIASSASIAHAARIMNTRHVTHLPVVDWNDRLVGIVSRADLLKVFLRPDGQLRDEIDRTLRHCPWAHVRQLDVTVNDGVVALSGRLHQRSGIRYLLRLLHEIDGIVAIDRHLTYDVDDIFPSRTEMV